MSVPLCVRQKAIAAVIIDARYSKSEIIEAYLNEVFGAKWRYGRTGFGLASYFHFDRPANELSTRNSHALLLLKAHLITTHANMLSALKSVVI